jgi:hypothetical protein
MDILLGLNTVLWVVGNVVALSIFLSALLFAIVYPILFNPSLTTAGKLIWRAIFSVGGFGLLAVIGIFIDGRVPWNEMPDDVDPLRPVVRFIVFGFIAYSYASLVGLLVLRRFFPGKIKVVPETVHLMEDDLNALDVAGAKDVARGLVEQGWTNIHLSNPGGVQVQPRDSKHAK